MKPNVLILAGNDRPGTGDRLKKVFESQGEFVDELSLLYTFIREKEVDLILIAEGFPGINPITLRKIRMRAPYADLYRIVESDIEREKDPSFDGDISLAEGVRGVSRRISRILKQRELMSRFGMVGHSEKIKVVAETIERIAATDISILIIGPSGTGKELVARAIHDNSKRSGERFVAINCGAIAEGILESELFGHEKGAFTGSVGKREGLFLQADGGTIFLDEIGETKPDMQVKLLRVLEDGVFYPVGGDKPIRSDVRVLAATNRDLAEAIGEGSFREDLYFRLGVVKINMPPLHERREDIIPLLYFFGRLNGLKGYSERAIDLLTRYDWPGNVRQLRNFAARMAALHPEEEVSLTDVEQFISEQGLGQRNLPVVTGHTREEAGQELIYHALIQLGQEVKMLRDLITANLPTHNDYEIHPGDSGRGSYKNKGNGLSLQNMEKDMIERALNQTGGNRKEAARVLGIGERTLYRKLKKYNLN